MRHLDITPNTLSLFHEGDIIATITGNNFGDQIIEFRKYITTVTEEYIEGSFVTFRTLMNEEGSHMSNDEIIEYGKLLCSR